MFNHKTKMTSQGLRYKFQKPFFLKFQNELISLYLIRIYVNPVFFKVVNKPNEIIIISIIYMYKQNTTI